MLYTAEKDESWYTKKGTKIVSDNTEQIFSLTGLDYKDYKWKIECEDSDKNSKATEERTFKIIDEVIDVKTTFSETEFTDELYAIIDTLSTKGLHERRVIDVLDIEKNIKSAIVTIQRAYRDINDATYNNVLSEKEKEDKIQTLETKISDTYNSIIVNVNVLENKAFIKYIRDPELKEVSDKYSTIKKYLDKEKFFDFVNYVKALGSRIAIDDFGAGYSNFSYMLELNPDIIKIDGSLIKNIDTDRNSYIITNAIINFTKLLKIETIAEYVHSEDVFTIVEELGINYFQGFLFSEAIPQSEIEELSGMTR